MSKRVQYNWIRPNSLKAKGQSCANSWQRIDRRATKRTPHLRATVRVESHLFEAVSPGANIFKGFFFISKMVKVSPDHSKTGLKCPVFEWFENRPSKCPYFEWIWSFEWSDFGSLLYLPYSHIQHIFTISGWRLYKSRRHWWPINLWKKIRRWKFPTETYWYS